jgi:hypothetical protein
MMVNEWTFSIVAIVTIANLVHALWSRRFRLIVQPSGPVVAAFAVATIATVVCVEMQVSWARPLLSVCFASWLTLIQALAMIDRSRTAVNAR